MPVIADYAGPGPHKFYLLQSNVKKETRKKNSMIAGAASFLFSCIMYTSQLLLSLPLNSACSMPAMQAEFDVQNLKGLCNQEGFPQDRGVGLMCPSPNQQGEGVSFVSPLLLDQSGMDEPSRGPRF